MSIRRLPQDVIDKIKSSNTITSLNGVVCNLLANALDAGASEINITVDYTRGSCTIEDNGIGIPPVEFTQDGGLGKPHHTSRFPPRATIHGKNGKFLASLATLSLLSIASRHQGHLSCNSITIHNSCVLSRNLPAPPAHTLPNFDYGTKVTVRDLFGSMPVRVKQRASSTDRPAIDRIWSKLTRDIVALLLAWPMAVGVSVSNKTTQRDLRFRPAKSPDIVSRTLRLLVQASLVDSSEADVWVPISASSGSASIKGCISKVPAATRRSQFISLGVHPAMNEFGTDVLYEEINRVFQNSRFGAIGGDDNQSQNSSELDEISGRELRSRKDIEKWPMFYFKIVAMGCTDADGVETLENQGQTLATILDLLKASCYGFLKKHQYRPRKVRLSPEESAYSTSKTLGRSKKSSKRRPTTSTNGCRSSPIPRSGSMESQDIADNPFDGWNRVKIGKLTTSGLSKTVGVQTKALAVSSPAPLVGEGGKLLRKPFDETPDKRPCELLISDPLPPRTGTLVIRSGLPTFGGSSSRDPTKFPEKKKAADLQTITPRSKWFENVTSAWKNPIFETPQSSIPRIGGGDEPLHHCGEGRDGGVNFDTGSVNLTYRISRRALAHGTVISQVDRKFILAKLPLDNVTSEDPKTQTPSSALVILDQHAVDERCRLEELMADYFIRNVPDGGIKADVEALERPLVFEVSSKEQRLLEQFHDHFASWGIVFNVISQLKSPLNGCKITVVGLPPSILERCRQEPRILIELLRKEIWHLVDDDVPGTSPSNPQADKSFVSLFHGCPKGILDMLHSRACRSAIMFNDPLTNEECEQLLSRLSECALPFQCAHGRPSMIPLVDVGIGGKFRQWQENKDTTSTVKWKTWMTESVSADR